MARFAFRNAFVPPRSYILTTLVPQPHSLWILVNTVDLTNHSCLGLAFLCECPEADASLADCVGKTQVTFARSSLGIHFSAQVSLQMSASNILGVPDLTRDPGISLSTITLTTNNNL